MKLYVYFNFCLVVLGVLGRLIFLAVGDYPRSRKIEAYEDAGGVVIGIAIAAWTAFLLFVK